MSGKIKTIKELQLIVSKLKKQGKKVGITSGCFDVVHLGHTQLFQFAKRHVDILIVCLMNDKCITFNKGQNRPVNNYKQRSEFLSEFTNIDYVFKINGLFDFDSGASEKYQDKIVEALKPTHIITAPTADTRWKQKQLRANKFGVKLLKDPREKKSSSTSIINKLLEKEF